MVTEVIGTGLLGAGAYQYRKQSKAALAAALAEKRTRYASKVDTESDADLKEELIGVKDAELRSEMEAVHKQRMTEELAADKIEKLRRQRGGEHAFMEAAGEKQEYVPYFGAKRELCSPVRHGDDKSYYYDPKLKRYFCITDMGASNTNSNFGASMRPGEPHPDASRWYQHKYPNAPVLPKHTRWAMMPEGWVAPGDWSMTGSKARGQPMVKPLVLNDTIGFKRCPQYPEDCDMLGMLDTQPTVRRIVRNFKTARRKRCKSPPALFFPNGETMPTGRTSESKPGTFFCPIEYEVDDEGDAFLDDDEFYDPDWGMGAWGAMPPGWTPYRIAGGQ